MAKLNLYLLLTYLSKIKNSATTINKKTASNDAVCISTIGPQARNIPLVQVFTPKQFTAPYSFKTSITIKKRPEKIAALEIGIAILKNVENSDKPSVLDKFMYDVPILENAILHVV